MLSGFVIDYAYRARLQGSTTAGEFVRTRVVRLSPLIVSGALFGLVATLLRRFLSLGGQWKEAATFPFAALALPASPIVANPFVLDQPA